MTETSHVRAALYVRISKDREGAGLGVERQRQDCEALAGRLGWQVANVYTDNDVSAYSGRRRPGYDQMCADVEAGRANAILAWHPDRLHRRPAELETFIDLCERKSVEVRTVTAGEIDLSTASGKMIARMLGAAARHEVEHSIERQLRAKAQASADGKYKGGTRPFGYESDGVTVREVEAEAIRSAAAKILAGVSVAQVTREWNEAGIRTARTDSLWRPANVLTALQRPRYAGLMEHQGKIVGPAQWPAIIDVETRNALVALFSDPSRRTRSGFERLFMGSGVYLCGRCGSTMQVGQSTTRDAAKRRYRIYRCSAHPHLTRVLEPLDGLITALVLERLSRPDAAVMLESDEIDVAALQVSRDALQGRLDYVMDSFTAGEIDGPMLTRGATELRSKMAGVDEKLAQARLSSPVAELLLGDDLAASWDGLSSEVKGKVIDHLMTVRVLPQPAGRQPGGGYFNPAFIEIVWKA